MVQINRSRKDEKKAGGCGGGNEGMEARFLIEMEMRFIIHVMPIPSCVFVLIENLNA